MTEEITASLQESLAPIKSSLEALGTTVATHSSTISDMETALTDHSGRVTQLEKDVISLRSKLTAASEENVALRSSLEDLVSRSKRQNLRVVGIPEDMEGRNPRQFMSELFVEVLGDVLPNPPELDRAHRSLGPKPRQCDRPRPILVRFHRYIEKELVLQWAKEHRDVSYKGHNIKFYEDFSASVARKRAAFNNVKSSLYKKGVRFGMLYPARLRVSLNGVDHYFDTPEKAELFFRQRFNEAQTEAV